MYNLFMKRNILFVTFAIMSLLASLVLIYYFLKVLKAEDAALKYNLASNIENFPNTSCELETELYSIKANNDDRTNNSIIVINCDNMNNDESQKDSIVDFYRNQFVNTGWKQINNTEDSKKVTNTQFYIKNKLTIEVDIKNEKNYRLVIY